MSHRFSVALGTCSHSFLARLAMIPIACLENIRHPTLNLIQMAVMMVVIVRLDLPLGSCTEHFEKRRGTHCSILRPWKSRLSKPYRLQLCSANVLATLADHDQSTPQGRIGN